MLIIINTGLYLFFRGRIICITSARDDDSIRSLAEIALNALVQQNKKLSMVPPTTSTDTNANTQYVDFDFKLFNTLNAKPALKHLVHILLTV